MWLTAPKAVRDSAVRLRVLLADDRADDRARIIAALQPEFPHLDVLQIDDAAAWNRALEAGDFDLVITEARLRWTDGVAVVRAVKARWPHCPVIIITAADSASLAVTAMKAGLDDYVLKGDLHRLPVALREVLATQPARDITERKRGEAEKAALLDVARDVAGTLDRHELLDRVQRRTASALPCDVVGTFNWDSQRNAFRLISHHGLPPELAPLAEGVEFPPDEPSDTQLTSGQTLVINDVTTQRWLPQGLVDALRITAITAAPLLVRGRYFGSLVACQRERQRPFSPQQVELLEGIARQLAVGLEAAELYRAQLQEAEVAGALARVGRELLSSLEMPVLLDRLCELTAAVLGCDYSHTYLWDKDADVLMPVSSYGDTPEQWEALRVLKIPRAVAAGLLARLETDEWAQVIVGDPDLGDPDLLPADRPARYGVTVSMYVALRRRGEIFGVQSAGYRGRQAPFTPQQERIAGGIAQLASMALTNGQLVGELGRANRLKSDFVATMSHELRTPLNIIMGYHSLLLDGEFGRLTAEQAERLRRAEHSARELLALINATLDVSRLDTGRTPVELQDVQVADLLGEIAAETRLLCEKPGLTVNWQLAPELPGLHTDPVKLKVVVKNLIDNAVKFTERGGVTINVRPHDGGVEITVSDTGVGMAPNVVPIVFEPFRQGDSSATRHYGGVGLGLYVVRRLLELLGGTVTVDSQLGRGTTFRVWVPAGHGTAAARAVGARGK